MRGYGKQERRIALRSQRGGEVTSKALAAKIKRNMFYKTELCMFGPAVCIWGSKCAFAHSTDELLPKPDLKNTKLCQAFAQAGSCSAGRECPFAHSPGVLRKGVQRAPASIDIGSAGKPPSGSHDSLLPQDTLEITVYSWFSGEEGSFRGMSLDPVPTLMPVPNELPMPRFLEDARLSPEPHAEANPMACGR
mmetsp:Transcript_134576/g.375063  ORF Transcript_134576/g.375063 Transcript_134576/m.375063 type:complete len:192 (+) Transcript_134576:63-638(+)